MVLIPEVESENLVGGPIQNHQFPAPKKKATALAEASQQSEQFLKNNKNSQKLANQGVCANTIDSMNERRKCYRYGKNMNRIEVP